MQLYYSPFACSLAVHIACREAQLTVSLHRSDLTSKRVAGAGSLRQIHPMAQVPALVTDDGHVLTEMSAVLLYVADHARGAQLAPAHGTFARYELVRFLSFVGSELHKKCLWPVFSATTPQPVKAFALACVPEPLQVLERALANDDSLLGSGFSVADAYLWWALTICMHAKVSFDAFPRLSAYHARHAARPAVVAAVSFERAQYKSAFDPEASAVQALGFQSTTDVSEVR